jgi:hypothetical protein
MKLAHEIYIPCVTICFVLNGVYISKGGTIMPATTTHDSDTLVLALATLGEVTEIKMILIAKVSKEYCITILQAFSHANLTNVIEPLRVLKMFCSIPINYLVLVPFLKRFKLSYS